MKIDLENPTILFQNHISETHNKYILLSAPFGYGKTYFLKDFFNITADRYKTFWLSPVKYVVGQNDDVFEYIKTDIAIQLLACPELHSEDKLNFSESSYVHQYLLGKSSEVAKLLFQIIEGIELTGDLATPEAIFAQKGAMLISKGLTEINKYKDWKKELDKSFKSNLDEIFAFASKQDKVKGSIYEDDIITQAIRLALEKIKAQSQADDEHKNGKENVLIIDDFDRLDPEHIFRILNILSIHRDAVSGEDKFGFDKVIIVCSIDNIQNIYKHKYGEHVDFDGYIEKFYSTRIFRFNNQLAISSYCQSAFSSHLDSDIITTLGIYLSFFVVSGKISIRSVVKHDRFSEIEQFMLGTFMAPKLELRDPNYNMYTYTPIKSSQYKYVVGIEKWFNIETKSFYINSSDFPILTIIPILTTIFGDYNYLKQAVVSMKDSHIRFPIEKTKALVASLIPIIHFILNTNDECFDNILFSFSKTNLTVGDNPVGEAFKPFSPVLENKISIPIIWNEKVQYDGSHSYYESTYQNFPNNIDYSVFNQQMGQQLINFLLIILNFLERRKMIGKLGITL